MRKYYLFTAIIFLFSTSLFAAELDVTDFGAVGDGQTDCTAAFQKALDTAGDMGGNIVNVPTGRFKINGFLVMD